jgi:undecaprenyl-diphosphatase
MTVVQPSRDRPPRSRNATLPSPNRRMGRHPGDAVRVGAGTAVAVLSAWAVRGNRVGLGEAAVFHVVNRLPALIGPPLQVVMQAGTLAAVGVAAVLALAVRRTRLAVDVALAGGGTWLFVKGVKEIVARIRPDGLLADVVVRGSEQVGLGFPSGHTAVAAALATVAAPWLPRPLRGLSWAVVAVVAVARVYVGAHLPFDVVGGMAVGWVTGAVVHLVRGAPVRLPTVEQVVTALRRMGLAASTAIPVLADARASTPFLAEAADGRRFFAKVVGREQRDADLLFKLYRFAVFREVEDEAPFATPKQQVEHEAYVTLLAGRAGVAVPTVVGVAAAEDGSGVYVQEQIAGRGLDAVDDATISDGLLRNMWQQVARLQRHRIAHRDLRLANWLVDDDEQPWLIDFGFAEAAAGPRRLMQDVAELLAATAARVGPARAVAAARTAISDAALVDAATLLQPLALSSVTRSQVRSHTVLDRLRAEIAALTGAQVPTPAPMTRVHPRTVLGLIAVGFAVHVLLPQVGEVAQTIHAVAAARVDWLVIALLMSALRYPTAALALMGATREPIGLARTTLVQLAGAFTGRLAPAGVGVLGLKERYLERVGLPRPEAIAALGLEGAAGLVVHIATVATAVAAAGTALGTVRLPRGWPLLVAVAALALLAAALVGVPWTRRRIVRPSVAALRGVGAVLMRPRQAAALFGGAAGLTVVFVLGLAASLRAYGVALPVAQLTLVYLAGAAAGSVAPTPGGLGVKDAAWVAGITALGVASGPAVAGVLTFRLLTFWLPLAPGALTLRHLRHIGVV